MFNLKRKPAYTSSLDKLLQKQRATNKFSESQQYEADRCAKIKHPPNTE